MKFKGNKEVLLRHHIYHEFFRRPVKLFFEWFLHIKINMCKLDRNEQAIVLCNHQTSVDPMVVDMAFNRNLYFLATDTLFSEFFTKVFLVHMFNPIPKKKGINDLNAVKRMLKIINEGGSICIFPEGNTTYGEFQFYIDKSLIKFIKKTKLTFVIENLQGGYGRKPRFADKNRRGPFSLITKQILRYDEYSKLSDDELYVKVCDLLKVYDSESNNHYKSKRKAEYVERELFLCPKCNKLNTLYSKGNDVKCHNCDLLLNYTETLNFFEPSTNKSYKMVEFYNKQKKYIKDMEIIKDEIIFKDDNIKLLKLFDNNKKRKTIFKGNFYVTDTKLVFEGFETFDVKDIEIASPFLGIKLGFTLNNENYFIIGSKRFNPLKYTLLFNKLDTKMKLVTNDKYYKLDD